MGLGHIFRELLGDDRHGHHRQYRHKGYRDRHHTRHHDDDHHDEHHDYYYDYGDREDCHSSPSRSHRYQPSYYDGMAAAAPAPIVICLSCERENPHDAKFCIECGSVLRISH